MSRCFCHRRCRTSLVRAISPGLCSAWWGKTGEEMPDWVADKQRRAEKIRQAKAELEAEAKAAAEAKLKAQA
jgi:hypothetical protein